MITFDRIYPPEPPAELIRVYDSSGSTYHRVTLPDWDQDRRQPDDDPEVAFTWNELLDEVQMVTDTHPRDGQTGWQHGHTLPLSVYDATNHNWR